jgi:FAD/FMN-containing dehydrogenase
VEHDKAKGVVHLGPGQSWKDAYVKMADWDVTVVGGRVGFVGVGGFTLGGGLSNLSHEYGLASDNLVDAQVVLADGRIRWTSTEPDLLFALRGAGFSFGGLCLCIGLVCTDVVVLNHLTSLAL